ncbi:bifunctional DNA primase/polymerase [Spirillospora sp. CA-128828]|uniref:bifunctional DNA primase/polymerase n=1 Tax=Spirillospora sp. CA-128828 TaxID=3240033 RepID=UPI003D90BC53
MLAERGFAVFPCGTPARAGHGHPAGPDKDCRRCQAEKAPARGWKWKERNSADPAVVRAHWPQDGPNIGVACHASGLVVIDLDTPAHGSEMPAEWTAKGGIRDGADVLAYLLEQQGEQWPDTFTVRTASGGTHLYFRAIPGRPIPNSAGKVGPMIDVRGDGNADGSPGGGYVIGPGSTVGGGRYTVDHAAAPVLPLPGLLAELAAPTRPTDHIPAARSSVRTAMPHGRLRGLVETVLAAYPGKRNTVLHWAACRVADMVAAAEVDEHAACDALAMAAAEIGLSESEARRTIGSALRRRVA